MTREKLRQISIWAGVLACLSFAPGCMTVFPVSATGKGCSGESADFYPARAVVEKRAALELSCPGGLQVEQRSDIEFTARGCGQSQRYLCEADAVSGCSLDDAAEREGCQPLGSVARRGGSAGL